MTKNLDQLRTAVTVAKHNEKVSWHRWKEAEARAEAAEESHRLANVMLRTVLEAMGSGPETDPIIKVRQLVARAEAAEAAVQRVRELATVAQSWASQRNMPQIRTLSGDILRALDGGEQK